MKDGTWIRLMIVALPAGLLLMGVGAIVNSTFYREESDLDPTEAIRLETAGLNRRPVSRDDLAISLDTLATRIGERHPGKPDQLERAAVWIESSLSGANMGYLVERQIYEAGGHEVRNLIAELPGRERRDEIIVVGAHYDTVAGSPGANDNGTGVAALLSLARAFAGDQQTRTIRFVAFVNEAPPYFQTESMGSLVYAKACRSRGEKIVAMISMVMLGESTDAKSMISFVGNDDSQFFADSARTAFVRATKIPAADNGFPLDGPGERASGHESFGQLGYPAVMVTATAAPAADAIDLENLESVTRGLKAVIDTWANP